MGLRRLLLLPAILLVLAVGQASAQDDWTILVYLAADNNLDWYFNADDDDVGEMTSAFDASKDARKACTRGLLANYLGC